MTDGRSVLFVCLHGSAKSVIAAHHLERLARERGLHVECASAGVDPDAAVPPHVIEGLRRDGFDHDGNPPRRATPELLARADVVVSFGCDLSALGSSSEAVVRWDGVPDVSDGYTAAREEISRRVRRLLEDLEQHPA